MRQLKISKQITNRESQSLDRYLQEIGKVELLTIDEEVSLTKQIKEGDQIALEKMVRSNLRFVVSVAKQYQNQGLTLGDLINEGNLGLIKAAQRFDETRGFKFISYAVWWIRQSIIQALAEQSRSIRLPLNQVSLVNKINKLTGELEQRLDREPSLEEIAEALELAPSDITNVLRNNHRTTSIDAPFANGEDSSLHDLLADNTDDTPDKPLIYESLRRDLAKVLETLPERESEVIALFYGLKQNQPLSLEEIGEKFNLTRERVRQIKEKAIKRMRNPTRSRVLSTYLG